MLLLIQKLGSIMLAMDVQQLAAYPPQLGHGDGTAVCPTDVLSVGADLPLQQQLPVFIRCDARFRQPREVRGHAGKLRADKGVGSPGADQLPGGPPAQHGAHSVDHDGLAGAGLTGQGIEPRAKGDVRRLDDGNIFDMQQFQHPIPLYTSRSPSILPESLTAFP